ncbi:hypothetical protein ACIPI6_14470 [Pseudomonas protegens]|uniref:hypothetical protein n=1 Tax=Pseudomonas protegens TaxID=380021 RepID=UPI0038116B06
MDEVIVSTVVAFLIPAIAFLAQKGLEKTFKNRTTHIIVKDEHGKEQKIIYTGKIKLDAIQKIVQKEYAFEVKVEQILKKYMRKNKKFSFNRNHSVDFLLNVPGCVIGLEVKTNYSLPSKKYFDTVKQCHPELDQLIFLFNSEVPSKFVEAYDNDDFVKFISSPREKRLSEELTSALDKAMIKLI